MLLAPHKVVKARTITVLRVLGIIVMISGEIVLSLILVWLIGAHGVIACGKGVFDDPRWYLAVIELVGPPLIAIVGGGALFLWSSSKRL